MENDEQIELLLSSAQDLEGVGDFEKALACYSRVLDILVVRAKDYAQKAEPGMLEAITGTGMLSQVYLDKFNEGLKKDRNASLVSCRMAALFTRLGDKASARSFFEQAIHLTPPGIVYDDPHMGISMLENK